MNPFEQLLQSVDESRNLVSQYIGVTESSSLQDEINLKVNNLKLQVMLYGAYNAGKSTLVNVLLGEEKAPINDIPTTFKVDTYDWNGVNLLDTPGVNAPIEHETATEEQVKRSSLMLFVIREGDQDSKDLYERLFSMLKQNKKIFIVLNHQAQSPEDMTIALQKINSILVKMGAKHKIDDTRISKISVYPMNLRTAYLARKKKSEKLLEHSGYNSFIQSFEEWLLQYDNEHSYLASVKSMVDKTWFSPVLTILKKQIGDKDNSIYKTLRSRRSILENEKNLLLSSVQNYIRQEVNVLKSDVSNALQNCHNQAELDSQLQTIFNPLIDKVQTYLENKINTVNVQLALPVGMEHKTEPKSSTVMDTMSDTALETTKNVITDPDKIKEGLLLGRKLKIPGLKGRWSKTFDKWAGKAAPVIQLAFAAYEVWKAGKDQDEHNEKERQQAISSYQAVEQICSHAVVSLLDSVSTEIESTFNQQVTVIQEKIDIEIVDLSKFDKDYEFLSKARDTMNSITLI